MITAINNSTPSFQNSKNNFSRKTKMLDKFIKSQENLSHTRFIQGTLTNWFPKAILSRSFIDFSEFTFLELLESGIFYFAAFRRYYAVVRRKRAGNRLRYRRKPLSGFVHCRREKRAFRRKKRTFCRTNTNNKGDART